jgi:hypothetical protein
LCENYFSGVESSRPIIELVATEGTVVGYHSETSVRVRKWHLRPRFPTIIRCHVS